MITSLHVTGMTCQNCVKHVGDALREVPGVTAVEVDLTTGRAKVVHALDASLAAMVAAITEAGYSAEAAS